MKRIVSSLQVDDCVDVDGTREERVCRFQMLSVVIIILSLLQIFYGSCPQSSALCADVEKHMEHLILTYLPLGPCCALLCFLPSKTG